MSVYNENMKIVFSRKGFDSGCGGAPSPIGPNGELVSLPIPGGSRLRYEQLSCSLGDMSKLVADLTRGRMRGREIAHLDPDLDPSAMPRLPGWKPALGQTGAAQGHLDGQGVGVGDVLLFFGWFRPVVEKEGTWKFQPGSESFHTLFGYLQIGEILPLGANPDTRAILVDRPWLADHPHITGHRDANNTLLIASNELIIDGRKTGLPGASHFSHFTPQLRLTAPGASKSLWRVPDWLMPEDGKSILSYHGDLSRWRNDERGNLLQTVAKGQEFVADISALPQAGVWVEQTVRAGLGIPRNTPKIKV